MIDEKMREIIADADREIAEALKPEGGQFGVGAKPAPIFRPHVTMVTQPETQPEPPMPDSIPETLAKYHASTIEMIGLISLNIGDLEERLNRRFAEIERVLGVTKS